MNTDAEKEWVAENMSLRPRSWDDIVISGRAKFDKCPPKLKKLLDAFEKAFLAAEKRLRELGYEAG